MKLNTFLGYAAACLCVFHLQAADTSPPAVVNISPPPGATVSNLTQVTVLFNEPVVSVLSWNLQINGADADAVVNTGSSNFIFTFTQPLPGLITISWEPTQNITDRSGNPFAGGASWQYTLLDTIPPALLQATPAPGSTVSRLTETIINFTEPVTGLGASDLRINNQPASDLSGAGSGPYLFQFAQPVSGLVTFSWNPAHNIADLSTNRLAASNWAVNLDPAFSSPKVRINEFLASNISSNGLDEFKQPEDWIELYNYGTNTINLNGFSLTDDPSDPGRWIFPSNSLAPRQYLIVFASGLNRRVVGGTNYLHTSFKLSSFNGYIGLFNAESPRLPVAELSYPIQKNDYSYGLDSTNQWRYFTPPTFNRTNGNSSIAGLLPDVHFSVERGIFDSSFELLLTIPWPGATIRYTTDGSLPTQSNGYTYSNALQITQTTTLRAAGFMQNMLPSLVQTHTYIFPDSVLQQPNAPPGFPVTTTWSQYGFPSDYGMDPKILTNPLYSGTIRSDLLTLPALSVVMNVEDMFGSANGIYTHAQSTGPTWERPCSVELIHPDGKTGFHVDAGIQMHGGGSRARTMKHPMRLLFKGKYGAATLDYRFFPNSPVSKFDVLVLRSDYNNGWNHGFEVAQRSRGTLVRDSWYKDVHRAMGGLAPHAGYVHLYINGLYWGVYNPAERPDGSFGAAYLGGEKEEYDAVNGTGPEIIDGNSTARNALLSISGLDNPAQYELIKQHLDITQYIDYMLLEIYGANEDWGISKNWYALRRRQPGATWKYLCWDNERTLEGINDLPMGVSSVSALNNISPDNLQSKLVANPEYRLAFADRVYKHLFNDGVLTLPSLQASWTARASQLDRAIVCESARWGDMTTTVGSPGTTAMNPLPYPTYTVGAPYTRDANFLGETWRLFNVYFPARGAVVLNQLRTVGLYPAVDPPGFSQHGGRVLRGFALSMYPSNAAYVTFYTTNGVDPRVYGSGAVSPFAVRYTNSLMIGATMVVKARCLSNGVWSALHEATFTVGELLPPLRITEIMYDPLGGDNYEFIELQNIGSTPLDLSGYYFDGITYQFASGTILNAGARMVLASNNNTNAWLARYTGVAVAGWYGGKLANTGEPIRIYNPSNEVVLLVDYKPGAGWPVAANGQGYSLEIIDPTGDPSDPANWQASVPLSGTPGLPPILAAPIATVVINEVMADNRFAVDLDGTYPDWVELYNSGTATVNLSAWSLTDDGYAGKWIFPSNTVIAPGEFLVIWCDSTTNTPESGLHANFALDRDGESVTLYNSTFGRVDTVSFGPQVADYSLGRLNGRWQLTDPTPYAANRAARVDPVSNLSINEWMANPLPGADDWIELYNRSTNPVSLQGLYIGRSNALCQILTPSFIAPKGFVQFIADQSYGQNHLDLSLPGAGGWITLLDESGSQIDTLSYSPPPEGVSQGRLPDGYPNLVDFPGSPSPGGPNYVISYSGPLVNEVLAAHHRAVTNSQGRVTDWVELYNSSNTNCPLAGWSMSFDKSEPGQWYFPTSAVLNARSYLVIWCDDERPPSPISSPPDGLVNSGRGISARSGAVFLFNPLRQVIDSVEFGFQVEDQSIGRAGTRWELLSRLTPGELNSEPAQLASVTSLRINEWMANPLNGEDDWFELYNLDSLPAPLSGLYLTDDPTRTGTTNYAITPLSFLGGNGFAKWIADGSPSKGRDHVNFSLDGLGETLSLYATDLSLLDRISYGFQPEGISQGRMPNGADAIVSFPATPTPGAGNYLPIPNVVINEVLSSGVTPGENATELYNPTDQIVPISGWFLSDDERDLRKFRIPNGTVLQPGAYLVIPEADFGASFSLKPYQGSALWLSQADGGGNLSGYRALAAFGAAETYVPFGRFPTSIGIDFPSLSQTTLGQGNAAPKVGPLVINEIMYHPPDNGGNNNTADEFIEIYNAGQTPIGLFDPNYPTNRWRLQGGVSYTFPPGTSIPVGGFLLVISFDPFQPTNATKLAAFQAKYGLGPTVPIVGPYLPSLANSGAGLTLAKPAPPLASPPPLSGYVSYIVVDRVAYGDAIPWPPNADGLGMSLQRRHPSDYGNEPLNWFADAPTPGQPSTAGPTLPTIVQHPQNLQVVAGTNVTLTVQAGGVGPLSYLWYMNGVPILEATNASLTLYNVQPENEGTYTVFVCNSGGSRLSNPAKLVVISTPRIIQPPQSQGGTPGVPVTFAVQAVGGNLRYQWLFNGTKRPNATNATFTLPTPTLADAGAYAVTVSNAWGMITSPPAYLVFTPPSIQSSPESAVVVMESTVTLTVSATGDLPLTYQWRKDGRPIFGATNSTFIMTHVQTVHSGIYDVVVSNPMGSATSAGAEITVLLPIQITQDPLPATLKGTNSLLNYGKTFTNVTFNVSYIGNPPFSFQWQKDGLDFPNATNSSLTLSNVSIPDEGEYRIIVSNPFSSATSAPARLLITIDGVVRLSPKPQTLTLGSTASFMVIGGGNPLPLTYKWTHDGAPAGNVESYLTTNYMVLSNITYADSGGYKATVVNSLNAGGASAVAYLTVVDPPIDTTAAIGANAAFSVYATNGGFGTRPKLKYQWQYNGANLAGMTNTSYTVTNVQPAKVGAYSVQVILASTPTPFTNTFAARLFLPSEAPVISTPPQDQIVLKDNPVRFSVIASGPPPLSYQWKHNGSDIPGATSAEYLIPSAQPANEGLYTVLVANYNGSVLSEPATLIVRVPPYIITQPSAQSVQKGSNATFTVLAAGPAPLQYQWQFNSADIPLATNATLLLTNVQINHEGNYTVVVANTNGSVTSIPAYLTVGEPPIITAHPEDQLVNVGDNASFNCFVIGTPPLYYQWTLNGVAIPGATNDTYTCNNIQYTNAGFYAAGISNFIGSVQTRAAELNVRPQFLTPAMTNGGLLLHWHGVIGKSYALESANHFTNWTALRTLSNSAVQMQFKETNAVSGTNCLYRLRQVP